MVNDGKGMRKALLLLPLLLLQALLLLPQALLLLPQVLALLLPEASLLQPVLLQALLLLPLLLLQALLVLPQALPVVIIRRADSKILYIFAVKSFWALLLIVVLGDPRLVFMA
jgi:hypothetical protein